MIDKVIARGQAKKMAINRFAKRLKKPSQTVEEFLEINEEMFWEDNEGVHYCDMIVFDNSDWIDKYFEGEV